MEGAGSSPGDPEKGEVKPAEAKKKAAEEEDER